MFALSVEQWLFEGDLITLQNVIKRDYLIKRDILQQNKPRHLSPRLFLLRHALSPIPFLVSIPSWPDSCHACPVPVHFSPIPACSRSKPSPFPTAFISGRSVPALLPLGSRLVPGRAQLGSLCPRLVAGRSPSAPVSFMAASVLESSNL